MDTVFSEWDTAMIAAAVETVHALIAAVGAGKSFPHARQTGTGLPRGRAGAGTETAAASDVVTNLENAASDPPA